MSLNTISTQPSKKRVIIITIAMALIVLGLLVAVIVVAVGKNNQKTAKDATSSGEVAIDSTAYPSSNTSPAPTTDSTSDPSSENLAPVSNTPATPYYPKNNGAAIVADSSDLPNSGPADFIPVILLSGALTAYLVSCFYFDPYYSSALKKLLGRA